MIIPLLLHMALQYIPLFTTGAVPFVGPGGALVGFVINLEHMCLLLLDDPHRQFPIRSHWQIYAGAF